MLCMDGFHQRFSPAGQVAVGTPTYFPEQHSDTHLIPITRSHHRVHAVDSSQ